MSDKLARGPTYRDLGEKETRRVIRSQFIKHPLTTVPAAIGALGLTALLALPFFPAEVFLAMIAGGGGLASVNFFLNYFGRRDHHALRHHRALHDEIARRQGQALDDLSQDLAERVDSTKGVNQLEQLRDKFNNLRTVLERGLNKGELTYSRYLGGGESVFDSVVSNLRKTVSILIGLSDINADELRRRILEIEGIKKRSSSDEQELAALEERLALYERKNREVGTLFAQNEEALTGLDRATMAATQIEIGSMNKSRLRDAMADLTRLARMSERTSSVSDLEIPRLHEEENV